MVARPARGRAAQCLSRKFSISPSMSPSSLSQEDPKEKASTSPAPSQDYEDDAGNGPHDQIWLTLRRRCELCKQRKVRALSSDVSYSTPSPFPEA